MKYCTHCGHEILDDALFCPNCGYEVKHNTNNSSESSGLNTVIKVFLVIACVYWGLFIIPLFWCIPITCNVFSKLNSNRKVSLGLKIFIVLFMNLIAGICLCCRNEDRCSD